MTHLSKDLLKLFTELLKYQAKKALGDTALEILAETLTGIAGDDLTEKLTAFLDQGAQTDKITAAFKAADQDFDAGCGDPQLQRIIRDKPLSGLDSLTRLAAGLPKDFDSPALLHALRQRFAQDWPQLTPAQLDHAASYYQRCLEPHLAAQCGQVLPALFAKLERVEQNTDDLKTSNVAIKSDTEKILSRLPANPPQPAPALYHPPKFPRRANKLPAPAPLPPASRLPLPRNQVFTGRLADLKFLAQTLLQEPDQKGVTIHQVGAAAAGYGGIGKTQLAVEFCYRYGQYFTAVHWINAAQDISAEIALCGAELHLTPWPDKTGEQLSLTLQAWSQSGPRLVVFDNLEDPALLRDWIPRLPAARLLVTSRRSHWPAGLGIHPHPLDVFPRPESLSLLRRLAPRLAALPDSDLEPLADCLGDFPLALDLAGRYLEDRPALSPRQYLDELSRAENLIDHASLKDWSDFSPTAHALSIAATFQLSWDRIQDETARRLLLACGWCAPNTPIPLDLLAQTLEIDLAVLDRHLLALSALGLLRQSEHGPFLHPLLSSFARSQDSAAACLPKLVAALARLSYAANMSGYPSAVLPIRPHLAYLAPLADRYHLEDAGSLYSNLAYHLNAVAEYIAARPLFERALAISEQALGPNHPTVATRLNNLASLLQDLGDLPAARPLFERALAIDEQALGPNHPGTAIDLNNLASLLQAQGDLPAALPLFERALAIDEQALGPNHPTVATYLNNLALLLQAQGDLPAARPLFERALAIDEHALGPNHPDVATHLNNLASLLQAQGDLPAARPLFERALAIDEHALGPNHPAVAICLNNLASLLQAQGDLPVARPLFERALAIDEHALGPNHPDTATDLNNLALLLQAQGDLPAARPLYERALAIDEQALGPNHPGTATDLNNLAGLLQDQGDLPAARPLYERALAIDERALGPNHPGTATDLNNLALLLKAQGDLPAARPLFERALAIDEQALGPNHPAVARDLNNLAGLLYAQGDLAAARPLYERALAIDEQSLGPNHPNVARDLNNLALLLKAQGDLPAARPLYERALAIAEQSLGPNHPTVAKALNNLAVLLQAQGDFPAARPLIERALAIDEQALGPNHPTVATRLNNLASLLQDLGDLPAARPLFERALSISEQSLGSNHPAVARDLNNLALLLQAQGDLPAALPLFERALSIFKQTLPADHPNIQIVLNNLDALPEK